MKLSDQEISKILVELRAKLEHYQFSYTDAVLRQSGNKVKFEFTSLTHKHFKLPRIFSYRSYVQETPFYTAVHIVLRFNYNNRTQPSIGYNLTSFRVVLDDKTIKTVDLSNTFTL